MAEHSVPIFSSEGSRENLLKAAKRLEDGLFFKIASAAQGVEAIGSFLHSCQVEEPAFMTEKEREGLAIAVQALGTHLAHLGSEVNEEASAILKILEAENEGAVS